MKHLTSTKKFDLPYILNLFQLTDSLIKKPEPTLLSGKIMASCFFEPSTRTRLSFETAMLKLGGQTTSFVDYKSSSSSKGESLKDTIKVISSYVDVIVLRHPKEGASTLATEVSKVPIINAGDGLNQHPTQTLLDLYTIHQCHNKLEGLHVALCGDLKHGRTVHSFVKIASLFGMRLYFVSPKELEMPNDLIKDLRQQNVKFTIHQNLSEILPKLDILYMTRIQKERFQSNLSSHTYPSHHIVTKKLLKDAKSNLKILHPLPRNDEIHPEVDDTPFACYFQQAENGLYVRQAILALTLGTST
ncbi:MAG: Aspartate carbamoyltransferase catalytic subunit [Chlamydiae bacterium]|nr:Aspartate carbamoyltransferase catalytic subunit [Chlamydiota bacterium]